MSRTVKFIERSLAERLEWRPCDGVVITISPAGGDVRLEYVTGEAAAPKLAETIRRTRPWSRVRKDD